MARGGGGQSANRKLLIVGVVAVVIIVSLLIAVIALAVENNDLKKDSDHTSPAAVVDSKTLDLLTYFSLKDGLDLKWFPWIHTSVDINMARSGKNHILDVRLVPGTSSSTPMVDRGSLSLGQFLDAVQDDNFVVNLYPTSDSVAQAMVAELQRRGWSKPVLLSVPVLSQQVNVTKFLETLQKSNIAGQYGVNLDLTSVCCDEALGIGLLEFAATVSESADYLVTVEIDAAVLASSWTHLQWLLNKEGNVKLIISANSGWITKIRYDLLLARNDADVQQVYYNLGKVQHGEFVPLASTAGSPLVYFSMKPPDAGKIIWSHNTDTWQQINEATSGDTMMIEGDIRLDPGTKVPIMAHDKGDDNNVTFAQWLEEIIKVDKGMKLDFKELEAVEPALELVKKRKTEIKGPIWANADILPGPGDKPVTIPADKFLQAVQKFPGVTLSLGWTTIQKGDEYSLNYTMDHVQQMQEVCEDLLQPVTFPIRAEQSLDSWLSFNWLLNQSGKYSLTVWTAHGDNVTKADMDAMKRKFEMSRIYFDLPPELRPTIP